MVEIVPRQKVNGNVTQLLKASGDDFISTAQEQLICTYVGISGDFHEGKTRKAGAREPWHPRGTEIRNERQISILSSDELKDMATKMGIDEIKPEWIGANIVIDGIKDLSLLPARTVLMFEGGVCLRVDGYNAPCRIAGGAIARHLGIEKGVDPERSDIALAFKDAGRLKRGLVAWVEREGVIQSDEKVTGVLYEQWLYQV